MQFLILKIAFFAENHSIDWFGPTIFIPLMVISQNPNIVSFCLNIVSNYVYDLFKGKNKDPSINCSFIYEDKQKRRKSNMKDLFLD